MAVATTADRVKETTTTTSTGTLDLDGAETGFQTFVAGIGTGKECYYTIVDEATGDWETGRGTVTDASPDTLSRDTVYASSNAGSLVNFAAGTKFVFSPAPAEVISPGNSVMIAAAKAAAATIIGTSSQTEIDLDTKVFDPDNRISLANNDITVPRTGVYRVGFVAQWAASAGGTGRIIFLAGSTTGQLFKALRDPPTLVEAFYVDGSVVASLTASEVINLEAWQNSGGDLNITKAWLWLEEIKQS